MAFKITTANVAGVSQPTRKPFGPLEINDQKDGVNGIVTDDIAGSGAKVLENTVAKRAGVVSGPLDRNFSTAYAN